MPKHVTMYYRERFKDWVVVGVDDQGNKYDLVRLDFPMAGEELNDAAEVEVAARRIADFAGVPFAMQPMTEDEL